MKFKKYLCLLISLLIAALNLNLILKPCNLVTGGTQGVAIIFNHMLKLSPSLIILIVNLMALFISYFCLSKETTSGTVVATFMYPLFVKLTSSFSLPLNFSEIAFFPLILLVILAGLISGLTGGAIYKLGFSNGGISIIALVLKKYCHLEVFFTNFLVNSTIVLLGLYYFGIKNFCYAIIVIFFQSLVIKLILKKSTNLKKITK